MDPLLIAALSSPNVNQYLAQQQYAYPQNTAAAATSQVPQVTTPSFQGTVPASTEAVAPESKGIGTTGAILTTVGVIGAGAAICGAYKHRDGKGICSAFKNLWKSLTGNGAKAAEKVTEAATKGAKEKATDISFYVKGAGSNKRVVLTLPNTRQTIKASDIKAKAKEYGIDLEQLKRFNPENSKVTGGTFKYTHGGVENTVVFKNGRLTEFTNASGDKFTVVNGKVTKGVDASGAAIPDASLPKLDDSFIDGIGTRISEIECASNASWSHGRGLQNVTYQTTLGDDILTTTFTPGHSGGFSNFHLDQLTTLKRCETTSPEVKRYLRRNPDVKTQIDNITQSIKDGVNPEGWNYGFTFKHDGATCHYSADGELIGITKKVTYTAKDGTRKTTERFFNSDSDEFLDYLEKNEKTLESKLAKIIKDDKLAVVNDTNVTMGQFVRA